MATLYFEVEADWTKVQKMREEVDRLQVAMDKTNPHTEEWVNLARQQAKVQATLDVTVEKAAKAGAMMRQNYDVALEEIDKKVKESAQVMQGYSETITRLYAERKDAKNWQKAFATEGDKEEAKKYLQQIKNINQEIAKTQGEMFELATNIQVAENMASRIRRERSSFDNSGEIIGGTIKADAMQEGTLTQYLMEEAERSGQTISEVIDKSIKEGATNGSLAAGEAIKDELGGAINELAEGGSKVSGIFNDIITMASGVSLGNLISGGIQEGYAQLKGVYDQSMRVRSEMQDIESTMNIFLGSAEKSQKFVSELEDAAYFNMFEFSELVEGSKQMLAYGTAVDSIIPRLNQLSEVATATHKPLLGLVDMYNRAQSIGYVDSRMAQSFAAQGLVIKDVLKEMGVASSGTKVSFEQLNQVLDYVTSEGGRFNGIMASQLNNISAEEGALEDALHSMYNEIGEIFEGSRIKTLKFQQSLVENWKDIAKYTGIVVSVFGTYRAALVSMRAAHAAFATQQGAEKAATLALNLATTNEAKAKVINAEATDNATRALLINNVAKTNAQKAALIAALGLDAETKKRLIDTLATDANTGAVDANTAAELGNAGAMTVTQLSSFNLVKSLKTLTIAMWESTAAALTNPYVLLAAALAAVAGAAYYFFTKETEEEKASRLANDAMKNYTDTIKERREGEERLFAAVNDTTSSEWERYEAYKKLKEEFPELQKSYSEWINMSEKERKDFQAKLVEDKKRLEDDATLQRASTARELANMQSQRSTFADHSGIREVLLDEKEMSRLRKLQNSVSLRENNTEEFDALIAKGEENAKRAKELYEEMNPNSESLSFSELAKAIQEIDKGFGTFKEVIEGTRKKEEELNIPIDERLKKQKEELDNAKKRLDNANAVAEAYKMQKASLDELKGMAEEKGINVSEFVLNPEINIDEETLRKKIIEAIQKVKKDKGETVVDISEADTEKGWLETAGEKMSGFLRNMGMEFGADLVESFINGSAEAAAQKAKDEYDKAENTYNQTKAAKESTRTAKEIQKEAKKNKRNLEQLKKRFEEGNMSQEQAVEALKGLLGKKLIADTELNNKIEEYLKNGGLSETSMLDLFEKINTAISDQDNTYKKVGGDDSDKAAQRAYDLKKMQLDNEKKIARERVSLAFDTEENIIKAMAEGTEKNLRQRDLDHRKELQKLKEQNEDRLKEAEETLKSYWMKQSDKNKEYNWDNVKDGLMAQNQMYKDLVANANAAYEAQVRAANIKYGDTSNLRSKYDKDLYDYEKKSAELAEDLVKLYEDRDNKEKAIADNKKVIDGYMQRENELTEEERIKMNEMVEATKNLEKSLDGVNRSIVGIRSEQAKNLDLIQKTTEEYVKNYGTAEQKMAQVNSQYDRNINDNMTDAQRASNEMQRNAALKKVYDDRIKDEENYNERRWVASEKYAVLIGNVDKQIAENKLKLQDETLSEEERRSVEAVNASLEKEKKNLNKEKQTQLLSLSMDALKQDPTYFMAFRDMTQLSNEQLESLNQKLLENAEELKNLPPDQLKTITDLLEKMDGVISDRDPFLALAKHTQEAKVAQAELIAAQNDEKEALIEMARLEAEINLLRTSYENGVISEEEYKQRLSVLQGQLDSAKTKQEGARNKALNQYTRLASLNSQIKKDTDTIYDKIKDWGGLLKDIGGQVGGIFGEILDACGDVVNAFMDVSKQLNNAMQGLEKASSAAGNQDSTQGVSDAAGTIANNAKSSSKMASVASKASAVMAGFQAGMSVGSSLVNLFEKTGVTGQAKYERYARKQAEINKLTTSINDYRRAAILAQQAESHWFGNSSLRDLQDQWKVAQQSQKNYFDKLNERQAAYRDQSRHDGDWLGNVVVGSLAGAITGAAIGAPAGGIGAIPGAIIGGVIGGVAGATTSYAEQALGNSSYDKQLKKAQDNLRIETQKKHRGFMWIGGQNQKTADLREWAREKYGDELFDKDGWINKELAESILQDYGDKLQGETQKTMEELIKLKDEYDEYQKSLKEYVNSLYSPLTDGMVDAIWSWYDEGRDALAAFKDSAKDTFRQIVNDLLKQIVLSNIIGTFQDDIKKLYDQYNAGTLDYASLMRQVGLKTKEMSDAYESSIPMLQDMVTTMADTIKETTGVDISEPSNRSSSGASNGFASMSQDTGNEMNGRLTVIQLQGEAALGHLTTLNNTALSMLMAYSEQTNSLDGIQQQIAASYLEVQGIHEDTTSMDKKLKSMGDKLNDWDQYIKKL